MKIKLTQQTKLYVVKVRRAVREEVEMMVDAVDPASAQKLAVEHALKFQTTFEWKRLDEQANQWTLSSDVKPYMAAPAESRLERLLDDWHSNGYGEQADREGWGVFDSDGRYEIQRDDEANVFASDDEAIAFVKAGEDPWHWLALDIVFESSNVDSKLMRSNDEVA